MERIKVKIDWSSDNFAAVTEDDRLGGMVIVTASFYDKLIKDLREAMASMWQMRTCRNGLNLVNMNLK